VSARATSSNEDDDGIDDDIAALEAELREHGQLAFATCEALRTDDRFVGLESCLRFLRCTVFAADPDAAAVPRRRRVHACRLMLLSLGAHTPSPRWTALQLEQLVESAMAVPGAELSDLVQAQFALLGETAGAATLAQVTFMRELERQIAGKKKLGHSAEDFIWLVVRLADPVVPHTQAQEVFARITVPRIPRDAKL
jgi:hypothetical protein